MQNQLNILLNNECELVTLLEEYLMKMITASQSLDGCLCLYESNLPLHGGDLKRCSGVLATPQLILPRESQAAHRIGSAEQHISEEALSVSSSTPSTPICERVVYFKVYQSARNLLIKEARWGLVTACLEQRRIGYSNDLTTDPRCVATPLTEDLSREIRNMVCFPVMVNGRAIGYFLGINKNGRYLVRDMQACAHYWYYYNNFLEALHNTDSRLAMRRDLKMRSAVINLKDMFVSTISHEIRTPLNGIVGMATLLKETPLNEQQLEYIRILSGCSLQLMELINDILDLTRMNARTLPLNNQPFILQETVQAAVDIVAGKAQEKGLTVHLHWGEGLPTQLYGDARRIRQILINLLGNAIKFTSSGTVTCYVEGGEELPPAPCPDNNQFRNVRRRIVMAVEDTGVGIDPVYHERIFEMFSKIELPEETPGTGLGLSISKKLLELMNGHITVTSPVPTPVTRETIQRLLETPSAARAIPHSQKTHAGTLFCFDLVVEDQTDIAQALPKYEGLFNKKVVIVVDDNEDNRVYFIDLLLSWGFDARAFSSAREVLSYVGVAPTSNRSSPHKSSGHYTPFDLALIDMAMPNMSGIELAQTLRERGFDAPLIGVSSIGANVNGREWFDAFHIKPVTKSQLFNGVVKCLTNRAAHHSVESATTRQPSAVPWRRAFPQNSDGSVRAASTRQTSAEKKRDTVVKGSTSLRILVAEDDYYNRIVLREMLKSLGYSMVTLTENGLECLEQTRMALERGEPFDLCLMDVKMPVMDGLDATRLIKQLTQYPVIVGVTASVLEADKDKCLRAGMDGYLPKPVQKERLAGLLERIAQQRASLAGDRHRLAEI